MFLDPHTTQQTVRPPTDFSHIPDASYHCNSPGYMKIGDIDPSLALVYIHMYLHVCVCVSHRQACV